MGAAWVWARSDARRRRGGTFPLALLLGLGIAVVLTTAAGARRTESAFERFSEQSRLPTHEVQYSTDDDIDALVLERLAADPGVERAVPVYITVAFTKDTDYDIGVFASPDPSFLQAVDRPRVLDGRLPDPGAATEVAINEFLARQLDAEPGDRMELVTFSEEQLASFAFDEEPAGPVVDVGIVGIIRLPYDIVDSESVFVAASPAFYDAYHGRAGAFGPNIELRVGPDADADAIVDRALEGVDLAEATQVESIELQTERVRSAIQVLTTTLWLFSACAAIAVLVAGGQALSRRLHAAGSDQVALWSLGMTRAQRASGGVLALVGVVMGAVVVGVLASIAASPLMPVGIARRSEPSPGVDVDVALLIVGGLGAAIFLLGIGAVSAWRTARATTPGAAGAVDNVRLRRSIGSTVAARTSWSPASRLGVAMALDRGRGRASVPVRQAIVGSAFGIAGVVAALTFGANLDHLLDSPSEYGWTWSIAPDLFEGDAEDVAALPEVQDVGLLLYREIEIAGRPRQGVGIQAIAGTPSLNVLEGRLPGSAREVAVGPKTAADLNLDVGDSVELATSDGTAVHASVSGVALLPTFDENPFDDGVVLHPDLLDDVALSDGFGQTIVGFAPGVNLEDGVAAVEEAVPGSMTVYAFPQQPGPVANLGQVDRVPLALAVFLVLVALAAIGHALFSAARHRRRDLAIVRSFGFRRREVLISVVVQSVTWVLLGVAIGTPLGVIVGRNAWILVAESLNVAASTAVPLMALVLLAAGALLTATVMALWPGRAAALINTAEALRAE